MAPEGSCLVEVLMRIRSGSSSADNRCRHWKPPVNTQETNSKAYSWGTKEVLEGGGELERGEEQQCCGYDHLARV